MDTFAEEASEILPGLYLGSQEAGAAPLEQLQQRGITHVLIPAHLRDFTYEQHPQAITYKQLHVPDIPSHPIVPLFSEAISFIEQGRASGSVLVHCQYGISRSASFVIAYVMAKNGWGFEQASKFVGERRKKVASNLMLFKEQLQLWEKLSYQLPDPVPHTLSAKDAAYLKRSHLNK